VTKGPKQGFSIPVAAWLRDGLGPFARDALSPSALQSTDLLNPAAAGRLMDAHVEGREDYSRQIWGLMALSLWCQRHPATVG
jgi:asparagine synthase (glutamine-hydrolysing)